MQLSIAHAELHVVEPPIQGSEGNPSLLFIHGAGGDASVWDDQATYFLGRHPAYLLDLPGHGGSGPSGEEDIGTYARWVRLVAERLFSSRPYVLVGHSMGGAVVLQLAVEPPSGMVGVVLVATAAKLAATRAVFHMLREDPEAFFEITEEYAFSSSTSREVRERFGAVIRRYPTSVITRDLKACDGFDIRDQLGHARVPALIICGTDDQLTPVKSSRHLHKSIPHSRLVLIPRAGHMVMAEQPAPVNQAIEQFLHDLGTGSEKGNRKMIT